MIFMGVGIYSQNCGFFEKNANKVLTGDEEYAILTWQATVNSSLRRRL